MEKKGIVVGDCMEVLPSRGAGSVQACVTSPPYWGLRDYGVAGQLGLEPTPEEYVGKMVEVFAEVRRVLADDGTLWLNLGDSYAGYHGNKNAEVPSSATNGWVNGTNENLRCSALASLKPKDLIGIPWRVAFALQQPYYTGEIKSRDERIWLAAMIDGEGCIFIHKRKAGQSNGQGYERKHDSFGSGLEVSNTNRAVVERCMEIAGKGSICEQSPNANHRRKQTIYRWNLRSNECRGVLAEVYPHLVAKHHEARLAIGCPSSGPKAAESHESLKKLHNGYDATIDFKPPEPLFRPGFYLRSDVIWHKPSPMPESVRDRPTKAHEYLFLLSKRERYWYDGDSIAVATTPGRLGVAGYSARAHAMGRAPSGNEKPGTVAFHGNSRNRRSVWTIPTQPFAGAHFAVFPPALVEPCILAGSREGDTVLDPFAGAGTVGVVCRKLRREFVGIELNEEYARLARGRLGQETVVDAKTAQQPGLFSSG
jgi:DNA modification methylase